jgi:hypothetical protein
MLAWREGIRRCLVRKESGGQQRFVEECVLSTRTMSLSTSQTNLIPYLPLLPLPSLLGAKAKGCGVPLLPDLSRAREISIVGDSVSSPPSPITSGVRGPDPSRSHLPNLRLDTSLGDGDARSGQAAYSPLRDLADSVPLLPDLSRAREISIVGDSVSSPPSPITSGDASLGPFAITSAKSPTGHIAGRWRCAIGTGGLFALGSSAARPFTSPRDLNCWRFRLIASFANHFRGSSLLGAKAKGCGWASALEPRK